jgi:serine phosphatase RsbU (regulator of sigma subunit)
MRLPMIDPADSRASAAVTNAPMLMRALSGVSIYGVQLSAQITNAEGRLSGGDWCDSFAIAPGVIALAIGDVCGRGVAISPTHIAMREAMRDAAHRGLDPAQTLIAAHYVLRNSDPDTYATAMFGLLDLEYRTFVFANAGHPAPLLCGAAGARFLEYPKTDLPLGINETTLPTLHTVAVPDASLLVFCTNGITEHDRHPLRGADELRAAAMFAYGFPALAAAGLIQRQMHLRAGNNDDTAIMTAWTPRHIRRSPARRFGR